MTDDHYCSTGNLKRQTHQHFQLFRQRQIQYDIIYMWNLKKMIQMYLSNRNRLLDFENTLNGYQSVVALSQLILFDILDCNCSPPSFSVHGIFFRQESVAIFLLQGIFLIQGSNPRLLCLLRCRRILYLLSHWGSGYQREEG